MPEEKKNDKDENKDEEELELKKVIEKLKDDNPELNNDDYNELIKAVDTLIKRKKEGIFKKIGRISLSFVLKYIVMFLSTTSILALFMTHLVIPKPYLFVVALIISVPFTLIFASQLFGIGSFQKRFLTKFFLANLLVIIVLCLLNYYQFRIFKFTADWIGIELLSGILFMILDLKLSISLPFY